MNPQQFIDERDILNSLGAFARILDDRDWSRIDDVFAEDMTFDYAGNGEDKAGTAALLALFQQGLGTRGQTQHLLGSIQIEWDGDTATTRAYVQARHSGLGESRHLTWDTTGEYTDKWARRDGGWRIVRRDARWFHIEPPITGEIAN